MRLGPALQAERPPYLVAPAGGVRGVGANRAGAPATPPHIVRSCRCPTRLRHAAPCPASQPAPSTLSPPTSRLSSLPSSPAVPPQCTTLHSPAPSPTHSRPFLQCHRCSSWPTRALAAFPNSTIAYPTLLLRCPAAPRPPSHWLRLAPHCHADQPHRPASTCKQAPYVPHQHRITTCHALPAPLPRRSTP